MVAQRGDRLLARDTRRADDGAIAGRSRLLWGMRCGIFLPLVGLDWPTLRERARLVERLGYDALWLDDHFWFPGKPDEPHLDAFTALAAVATVTERIALGPLVACHSYRSPALLAKIAASLAEISGDRFVLGLGAGWMEEEYRAYGYPFPPPRDRIAQLADSLEILLRMRRDPRATYPGRHHQVREAPSLPKPKRMPILLGGVGDRLLHLAARYADGWNVPNPSWRELAVKRDRLRALCAAAGRDPAEVAVSEQVMAVVGANEAEARRETERAREILGTFAQFDGDVHVGTPAQVAESLRARGALGVEEIMVMLGDFGSPEQIEIFAREVVPLL
jgi:probable F420-dependent oxidoreductase